MSAPSQTKIFGMKVGLDPKILLGGLLLLAALLFWYNSRGSDERARSTTPNISAQTGTPVASAGGRARPARRQNNSNERGIFRLRQVDGSDGRIDPTLHLGLLSQLRSIAPAAPGRSLFEAGPVTPTGTAGIPSTVIVPKPIPARPIPTQPIPSSQAQAAANIPLKYYGFENRALKGAPRRGLFLDNDNVLVASEGELVNHRYLVVELTPSSARMEDTQIKQGQTLPVVPEAAQQ
ncbi:MAG: hypothetical protein JO022_04705 [Acidobacteriaceae bacterium]|nr:hypothetical protein [Acidobacteriaceae bacterium]